MGTRKKPGGRFGFGSGVFSLFMGCQVLFLAVLGIGGFVVFWQAFVLRLVRRGWSGDIWVGLLPLVFTVFAAIGIWATFRFSRTEVEEPLPSSTIPEGSAGTLKPVESRESRTRSALGLALFWNLIVAFFVAADVAILVGGEKVGLGIFMALFLIPFVLIGLHLAGNAWRAIRGQRNPVPAITLGRAGLPLGEAVPFEWRFTGRTDRLTRLRITLEGAERSTRSEESTGGGQRSRTIRTEEKGFAQIEVFATEDPVSVVNGSAEIRVPAETVPSFRTTNAQILWRLKVAGATRKRPSVEEEFDVVVVQGDHAGGAW
jgi:hypothetical protein